jgi:hypothetical protein
MSPRPALALALALALPACGSGGDSDDDAPIDAAGVDAPDGWQLLLQGDWQLAAGEEAYFCVYATVPATSTSRASVRSSRPARTTPC